MTRALAVAAVIAAAAPPAHADDGTRDTVVSTQVWAAFTRGLSLQGEHRVAPHLSVVIEGGLRGGALGDYSSTTWMLGADLRWWFRPRGPVAIAGPYLAAHASAGRTSLVMSATGDGLGTSWGLEQRADVGWRFTIRGRVALTPSLGVGTHEDLDGRGRLAPTTRSSIAVGLELGCLL